MTFAGMAVCQAWLLAAAAGGIAIGLFLLKVRPPRINVPSLMLWTKVLNDTREQTLWERIRRAVSLAATAIIALALAFAFTRPMPAPRQRSTSTTAARLLDPAVVVHSVYDSAANAGITAFDVRPPLDGTSVNEAYLEVSNFGPAQSVRVQVMRGDASLFDKRIDMTAGESLRQVLRV